MAKKVKIKDTDYLFLSSYIHARETKLVDGVRLDRMLEAKSPEDALKILEECGWPALDSADWVNLERMLAGRREDVYNEMRSLAPNPDIVDLFRIKYDYHNAKVLIKARATGADGRDLMSESGRMPSQKLTEAVLEENFTGIPKILADAYMDAADTLSRTGDPQIADFIIDKAYFSEYLSMASTTSSPFLEGYVRLSIDTANIRSVVRAKRMAKDIGFLEMALVPGGTVDITDIKNKFESSEAVLGLFGKTPLEKTVQAAQEAGKGGRLTRFEKLCDEVLLDYLSEAKMTGFNEKPLIRYLCAVEAEISAVRIIMTGHFSGLPAEKIKERLREGL